ncbi:DgyrCDS7852 [Dimorphilus gyrociliatus]|uniref:DgyrCDS7852 n=1 Tax=Dimorphilus gyrociliatus TaxID=2664684 RepID=A0A7I8VSE9_9ANNE|nr:DgyrCDS7852 [Dimorphilus gyrociliatus]
MNDSDKNRILRGKLENIPQDRSRSIRIFISSTFTDMAAERNILMMDVYPKLSDYCRKQYGCDFQLVDLRWGIQDQAVEDHETELLCIEEIKKCQKLSIGPSFVVFLGQKHGYCPLPRKIPEKHFIAFEKVATILNSEEDLQALKEWYKLDENAFESEYVACSVSEKYPNFLSEDKTERSRSIGEWRTKEKQLTNAIKVMGSYCVKEGFLLEEDCKMYFMSMTEKEVMEGLKNSQNLDGCVCFIRHIEDLQEHLEHPADRVWRYIDIRDDQIDTNAQSSLSALRDNITQKMPDSLIFKSNIKWNCGGKGVNEVKHREYLSRVSNQFYEVISRLIDDAMTKQNVLDSGKESQLLFNEIIQHLHSALNRINMFQGREQFLTNILNQVKESNTPIIVHSPSGCGKTSVMAMLSKLIPTCFPNVEPIVIVRFLGTTPFSSNIRSLLRSICEQISKIFNLTYTETSDFSELIKQFYQLLNESTEKSPLILLLDSIDQLSVEDGAHKLSWLPLILPKNTYILVSTLSKEYGILDNLKERLPNAHYNPLKILGGQLSIDIIKVWLTKYKRKITQEQESYLVKMFSHCSLPIFVKLAFDSALTWKSFQKVKPPERTKFLLKKSFGNTKQKENENTFGIENSVQGTIHQLFKQLEKKYGRLFVCRALGYLTCNPQGLSEMEMQDVLSLDDEVLGEVFQYHIPPVRRIPSFLWARLRHSISPYLTERESHGTTVHFWYHRQFIEVATSMYVEHQRKILHTTLSEFYSGTWYNKPKPFQFTKQQVKHFNLKSNNSSAHRNVPNQPIINLRNGTNINYNLRKLYFLPYHYTLSKQFDLLFSECLFNYEWIKIKLVATGINNLIEDFRQVSDDEECSLVYQSLSSVRNILLTQPDTLSVELIGRLYELADDKRPKLKDLIKQCLNTKDCIIKPLHQCYPGPGGARIFSLQHNNIRPGENIIFSSLNKSRISTITDNNDLVVWDLETGVIDKEIPLPSLTDDGFSAKLKVYYLDKTEKRVTLAAPFHEDINRVYQLHLESCELLRTTVLAKSFPSVGFVTNMQLWSKANDLLIFIKNKIISKFDWSSGNLLAETNTNSHHFHIDDKNSFIILTSVDQIELLNLKDFTTVKTIQTDTPIFKSIYHDLTDSLYRVRNDKVVDILSCDKDDYGGVMSKIDLRKYVKSEEVRDCFLHEKWLFVVFKFTIICWDLKMNKFVSKLTIPDVVLKSYSHNLKHSLNCYSIYDDDKIIIGFDYHLLALNIINGKVLHNSIISKLTIDGVFSTSMKNLIGISSVRSKSIDIWSFPKLLERKVEVGPLNLKWFCRFVSCSKNFPPVVVTRGKSTETRVWDPENCCILSKPAAVYEDAQNYFTTPPIISYDGKTVVTRDWILGQKALLNIWDSLSGRHLWSIPIDVARLKRYTLQMNSSNSRVLLTHLETAPDQDVSTMAWDIKKRCKILEFPNKVGGFSAVETTLNDYVILLQQYPQTAEGRSCTITVYNLKRELILTKKNILKDSLTVVQDADIFYVVETDPHDRLVKISIDLNGPKETPLNIVPHRNLNVCKDGSKGIDADCSVYDINMSKIIAKFESGNGVKDSLGPYTYPRLSFDGRKAAWLSLSSEQLTVACTATSSILGRFSTHSTPLAFDLTASDIVVIGCQDGKVSFLKIADEKSTVQLRGKSSKICAIL